MTGQTRLTGMVLNAVPAGEYDRRLTILTKERGKISAFAKGARKPTSALLACSQPFSFGEFTLHEGRDSYHVVAGDISNYFAELRDDIEAIYYGMYFCEFAGYLARENMEAGEQLKLLYQSLRAAAKPTLNKRLVRCIFELRSLCIDGEMPEVYSCASCGREDVLSDGEAWFSSAAGGLCCRECKKNFPNRFSDTVYVSTSAIYALQYIVSTPIEKLYTFAVSDEVLEQLAKVSERFLKKQVGHEMKSEQMLKLL